MIVQEQAGASEGSIGDALQRLYMVISFEEGGEPDWDGLRQVFSEHARITRITPEGTDYLDPKGFLQMTQHLHDVGAYTSFYEFELARQVEVFGNVAQVWSFYETRRHRRAQRPLGRGVNSIQLIRDGQSWRVFSLLWDEVHASAALDVSVVFPQRGQDA
jgi:hypothetical protein